MNFHPVCELFPKMPESDFLKLKDDIAKNGLIEPIWLSPSGEIIDGRHRYLACKDLGIEPDFRTYEGESMVEFVMSLNLNRRHLSPSQAAMVASKALPLLEEQAKKRMGSKSESDPAEVGKSADKAGEMLGVSGKSVAAAKTVLTSGSESLIAAVEGGEVSVSAAAAVASSYTEEEQEEIVKGGSKAVVEAAKAAKKPKEPKVKTIEDVAQDVMGMLDGFTKSQIGYVLGEIQNLFDMMED